MPTSRKTPQGVCQKYTAVIKFYYEAASFKEADGLAAQIGHHGADSVPCDWEVDEVRPMKEEKAEPPTGGDSILKFPG